MAEPIFHRHRRTNECPPGFVVVDPVSSFPSGNSLVMPGTQTGDKLLELDPQSYVTATYSPTEALVGALKRDYISMATAGIKEPLKAFQHILGERTDERGVTSRVFEAFRIGGEGDLHVYDSKQEKWKDAKEAGTSMVYCDHLGMVRERSGKVIGQMGFDRDQTADLKLKQLEGKDGGGVKGMFVSFDDPTKQVTFAPVTGTDASGRPTFGIPTAYDPVTKNLSGQKTVIAIGTPPSFGTPDFSIKGDAVVKADTVDRDKDGKASKGSTMYFGSTGYTPGSEVNLAKEYDAKSDLVVRKAEDMRTDDKQQRWQYLEQRDSATGATTKLAYGVSADGKLLKYVGETGNAEDTRKNGWRDCEKEGTQHLFIRKDFTVVDKDGKIIGVVDPKGITTDSATLKTNADKSTSGMFATSDLTIITSDGKTIKYDAKTFGLGDSKAVIQFGDPVGATKLQEPLTREPAKFNVMMEVARAGGLVDTREMGGILTGQDKNIEFYMTKDGSGRFKVDASKFDAKRYGVYQAQEKDALERLAKDPENADMQEVVAGIRKSKKDELAKIEVTFERRVHVMRREVDCYTKQAQFDAVWEPDRTVHFNRNEFRENFKGIFKARPDTPASGADVV